MTRLTRRLITAVAAIAACTLCLPAHAGKGGFGGGMSRSMGGSASRSMGGMSGMSSRGMSGAMNMRSIGTSNMSRSMPSRSFSVPARSTGGSSFNARPMISGGVSRNIGGSMTRNVGAAVGGARVPTGGFNNSIRNLPGVGSFKAKSPVTTTRPDLGRQVGKQLDSRLNKSFDRGVVRELSKGKLGDMVGRGAGKDLGKSKRADMVGRGAGRDFGKGKLSNVAKDRMTRDRMSDLLGGKSGTKNLADRTGRLVSGSLKTGRMRTGDLAKIDRSKLRDLVRGIEAGKAGGGGSLPTSGKSGGFDGFGKGFNKGQIADAILGGGLKPFHPGNGFGGAKNGVAGILAAGCFPHHDHHHHHHNHHHHGHWFDFCFGNSWFDDCYGYPYYEPYCYDYYSYPIYTDSTCGVTFTTYPEVVTVAAAPQLIIDQEIDLLSGSEEMETAKPVVEDLADDDAAAQAEAGEAASEETAADDAAGEESAADETQTDETVVTDSALAGSETNTEATGPAEQPEMDLELIDVQMVDAGNAEAKSGPSFQVTVRNAGRRDLAKFLVSLVACKDTQIDSDSLHGSATVEELTAGDEATVTVTLPVEALSLNRDGAGRTAPYGTLVAAVDSDERINEGNEENNLALIDRTSIKLANN